MCYTDSTRQPQYLGVVITCVALRHDWHVGAVVAQVEEAGGVDLLALEALHW